MKRRISVAVGCVTMSLTAIAMIATLHGSAAVDHDYAAYGQLLRAHVRGARVDYAALKADRSRLDAIVSELAAPTQDEERGWPRAQRMAWWINAYNVLTLQAIVNHYPIQSRLADTAAPQQHSADRRRLDGAGLAGGRPPGDARRHRASHPASRVRRRAHPLRRQLRVDQLSAARGRSLSRIVARRTARCVRRAATWRAARDSG